MSKEPRSFFSEHTAEFILVPRMQALLSDSGLQVVPITYWKSREGNALAASRNYGRSFRLVALFPRRPKLLDGRDQIFGKVNWQLFQFASESLPRGIPVFAGLPVISSLWECTGMTPVQWLSLNSGSDSDVEFVIDRSTLSCSFSIQNTCCAPIPSHDVLLNAMNRARVCEWNDAMNLLEELRRFSISQGSWRPPFGGPRYKPVYFLILETLSD